MEERKILVARTAGFCFGVKRAVEKYMSRATWANRIFTPMDRSVTTKKW